MDYIKLRNNATVTIEDNASLNHIVHVALDETEALNVCNLITEDNIELVKFYDSNNDCYGTYDNLTLLQAPYRQINEDHTISVVIMFRELTPFEKKIRDEQQMQNAAIDYLVML